MAVTIYHEIIHAYLGTTKKEEWDNDVQHNTMTSNYYLNLIKGVLMIRFPSISTNNATALRLAGLSDTPYYVNLSRLQKDTVDETIENYKNKTNGTYCN
jgi:hypothetical protein